MDKKTAIVKAELRQYDIAAPNQMAQMANVLKDHVIKQGLYSAIQGKNYVHVEGWQFAGGLLGTYPRISKIENLSNGTEKRWLAEAEIIRIKDGAVIGFGAALCSTAEAKKRSFDEYAVLSMAQTRAIGKAYRNSIGWVMKLAGYEGTPAEEMVKSDAPVAPQKKDNTYDLAVKYITSHHDKKTLEACLVSVNANTEFTNQQKLKLAELIHAKLKK